MAGAQEQATHKALYDYPTLEVGGAKLRSSDIRPWTLSRRIRKRHIRSSTRLMPWMAEHGVDYEPSDMWNENEMGAHRRYHPVTLHRWSRRWSRDGQPEEESEHRHC